MAKMNYDRARSRERGREACNALAADRWALERMAVKAHPTQRYGRGHPQPTIEKLPLTLRCDGCGHKSTIVIPKERLFKPLLFRCTQCGERI